MTVKAKKRFGARRNRIRMTTEDKIYQVIIYFFVSLITLLCFVPLVYVVGMSLTSLMELTEKNNFVLIPLHPTLESYKYILKQANLYTGFLVSLFRTFFGVGAMLIFVVPGGYILAKHEIPGRRWFMLFFITTMLISGGTIPAYMLVKSLGLLDSIWVYIVPAFGSVYNMLIVKIFVEGMPRDIIESADLDGASELQKMVFIAIPLLVPTICALSLFTGVAHWNSWFDALLYVKTVSKQPVQLLIHQLFSRTVSSTNMDGAGNMQSLISDMYRAGTDITVKMACVVIAMLPIMCVYPFLQKYFIFGMYTGSVKG
ncbi:MAG: carbohydrate ABC transporter permease [Clostridia bacterium]|nr:carbohydrate ABC transporter permease [Clostridia bacterium]